MDKNKCPKIDFSEMMLEKRKMCILYNKLPKVLKDDAKKILNKIEIIFLFYENI